MGQTDCCETYECATGPDEAPRLVADCWSTTYFVEGSCIS